MIFGKWDERAVPRGDLRPAISSVGVAPTPEIKKQAILAERPLE